MSEKITAMTEDTSPSLTDIFPGVKDPGGTPLNRKLTYSTLQTLLGRTKLTADTTYYVSTTGSDTTGDGSSGSPWATWQHAYDYVAYSLDVSGYNVTVQIADGTYGDALSISQPWTGGGTVTFKGNATTPSNVLLSLASTCITVSAVIPSLTFEDFKLTTTSGHGIYVAAGAIVNYAGIDFGSVSGYHILTKASGANVIMTGDYTISGGATVHYGATKGYIAHMSTAITVTLTGTPAFSYAFASASRTGAMSLDAAKVTFSGTASGAQYAADTNGVIYRSGSALPGSSAGTTGTGGQFF